MEIRPEVQQGVTLLDRLVPDWRETVDVEKLRMTSPDACIVGQLAKAGCFDDLLGDHLNEEDGYYREYYFVVDALEIIGSEHGFTLPGGRYDWEQLQNEWVQVIEGL